MVTISRIALVMAAAAGAATGASAATTVTGYGFVYSTPVTGTLRYTGQYNSGSASNINTTIRFGEYKLNQNPTPQYPIESYCIDIFQNLVQGSMTFNVGSTITLNSNYSASKKATKLTQLKSLLSNLSAVTNATQSAGMQLALWEILYEPVTTSYNVGAGYFYMNNLKVNGVASGAVATAASGYLAKVTGGDVGDWTVNPNLRLKVYSSGSRQDQVSAFVPEPSTWAMMVAGFGAVGVAMRRRRRQQRLATA